MILAAFPFRSAVRSDDEQWHARPTRRTCRRGRADRIAPRLRRRLVSSRTARSMRVTRARTAGGAPDGPGADVPSGGDVAIDVPSGADHARRSGGRRASMLRSTPPPRSTRAPPAPPRRSSWVAAAPRRRARSAVSSLHPPRPGEPDSWVAVDSAGRGRTTAPRGEGGSGSATTSPCATPPACPGRPAGPIWSWRSAARRRAASWPVVRRAAPAATASTPAAPAGGAPAVHARPACAADSPARRPPSAVPAHVPERIVRRRPGRRLRLAGRLLAGRMPRRALPVRRRSDPVQLRLRELHGSQQLPGLRQRLCDRHRPRLHRERLRLRSAERASRRVQRRLRQQVQRSHQLRVLFHHLSQAGPGLHQRRSAVARAA